MIFVNGLQRSGTNFAKLQFKNSVDYCWPYWKHDLKTQDVQPMDCSAVKCIIKNPYTWVESICFRNPVDIIQWFSGLHLYDQKDYLGPHKINLIKLISLYSFFYTSWMAYEKTKLIKYEDLLVLSSVKVDTVDYSTDWDPSRRKSYLKYETTLLNRNDINTINETLGKEFFKKINYPMK